MTATPERALSRQWGTTKESETAHISMAQNERLALAWRQGKLGCINYILQINGYELNKEMEEQAQKEKSWRAFRAEQKKTKRQAAASGSR